MSFQGIRKIRQAKRESPLLFDHPPTSNISYTIKPLQFNSDLKSSNISNQIRSTRDSENRVGDGLSKQIRKSSFGMTSSSKEKEKKTLIGNFLHINLEGIKGVKVNKEIKKKSMEISKTDRLHIVKSNTQDTDRSSQRVKISLASFSLEFVVGKGGFGKVWKVHEKSSNKIFAMKQMQKVKIISKRSVHSVMNQQNLLHKLKSPFLVNMVHSFQNRQNLFLVMDYCNRGDLRYHLGNKRKFKQNQARFFLACIVLSLEYLHGKKVIHRDLKPENLVLDERGYVRVTDLGVSRQAKPNNAEDTSGTPGYMAPEVICKMNHSYPVDFFALGVMAYEFMTGKRPYIGQNRKEIRQKILAKQIQLDEIPVYGWSRQSVDLINRLIQRRAENRLGTSGIEEIKYHPFFKKIDWEKLAQKKIMSPFLPETIQEDYINYKECISEDTEIQDIQEYQMILRHRDTQEAFCGYDYNTVNTSDKRKQDRKKFQLFTHTTMSIKKK